MVLTRRGIPADVGTLELDLVAGRSVRGRIVQVPGAERYGVSAKSEWLIHSGSVSADGTFLIEGLTDERWTIQGMAYVAGRKWWGEAELDASGGDVEIRLKPVR